MSTRSSPRRRMEWQGNLGQMKKHGTRVREVCHSPCRYFCDVDLDVVIASLGPQGDLWDCHGICPECGKETHYMSSPGPGTVFRPMLSE